MLFEQIPAYLEFFGFPTPTPEELRAVRQDRLLDQKTNNSLGGKDNDRSDVS